jgi:hypothetical protein
MHTRVYGQASILTLLVGFMFFRDHMERHGKYLEVTKHEPPPLPSLRHATRRRTLQDGLDASGLSAAPLEIINLYIPTLGEETRAIAHSNT